jgi:hypothetical protein
MKSVYLIGFVGVGMRDNRYKQEHGLIIMGHVGIAFEGRKNQILGFHPTPEAIEKLGDSATVMNWLRNRKTLDGCLQNDTEIFKRAYYLSQENPNITVWQYTITLQDNEFDKIQSQAMTWYNEKVIFSYGLPIKEGVQAWDNCATFPKQLGLPIPEPSGYLVVYIPALKSQGKQWQPEDASP